jgi:hypothetical protein
MPLKFSIRHNNQAAFVPCLSQLTSEFYFFIYIKSNKVVTAVRGKKHGCQSGVGGSTAPGEICLCNSLVDRIGRTVVAAMSLGNRRTKYSRDWNSWCTKAGIKCSEPRREESNGE